ncbi:HTH-type transcriptional repressor RspR [bioreactor metagenome]|uniref:HTH-type transcriptional repressor RspR n=1 Tax=bioreactor metagenome TaxID=1076179 RepID=A0A645FBF8_9ZZZZ
MILRGELKSDQAISERYISQMLNVSTTPVKEAFRILQSEGLIYAIPRKGSYISPMSRENMEQITFIRSSLEGVAAYYAALKATDDEIACMTAILDKVGRLIAGNRPEDRERVSEGNTEFHQILRSASRNSYLLGLLENLRSIDKSIRTVNLNLPQVAPEQDHAEHLAILNALSTRNAALAEQAMISHIRRVAVFVLEK